MKIRIPEKRELVYTGESDPLDIYYLPFIKYPFIQRLKKAVQLLGTKEYNRLLEVGTGSGILIPELSNHCKSLYCIDVHEHLTDVEKFAKRNRVHARVSYGDILDLKFKPKYFDAIICISVLEHLVDVGKALDNLKRVLKDNGVLVLGFPTKNIIGEKIIEVISPGTKNRHISDSVKIIHEVKKRFRIVNFNNLSVFYGLKSSVYTTCKCVK